MSDANLLSALKKYEKLTDIQVIGKVKCLIEKPTIIGTLNISEGNYALVDVYALKCFNKDYFGEQSGYYDKDRIYLSLGTMVICLLDTSLVGKVVKVGSKGNLTGTVKRQTYVKDPRCGVHCFAFRRVNNDWIIAPNIVKPLLKKDISGTILEDYLQVDEDGNEVAFNPPESVNSIIEYYGCLDYKEISKEEINSSKEDDSSKIETLSSRHLSSGKPESIYNESGMVDVSKIDLHLVKHLKSPERSEFYEAIQDEGELMRGRMAKTARMLCREIEDYPRILSKMSLEDYDEDSLTEEDYTVNIEIAMDIRRKYIAYIASNYDTPISSTGKSKGKEFVLPLVNSLYDIKFVNNENSERMTESQKKMYTESVDKIKKGVQLNPDCLSDKYEAMLPILGDDLKMATLMIGNVTGVGEENLVQNYNSCARSFNMNLNFWFCSLIMNPYYLALLGTGINLVDCDNIYWGIGFYYLCENMHKEDFEDFYNDTVLVARRSLMLINAVKSEEESTQSTLVSLFKLSSKNAKFYPDRSKKLFVENGLPMLKMYIDACSKVTDGRVRFPNVDIVTGSCYSVELVDKMEEMGVLDRVNDSYISLAKNIFKEFYIYKVLYEKGCEETGITDDQVESTIKEFEAKKGFGLEKLQKEGIGLVKYKAAVLSGCAGSGKTTTSDCMSMALEKYLKGYEIIYGTPTGKACRRLAEVVGGNVRTLHSLFGVGIGSEPILVPPRERFDYNSKKIYILDEMAMCNIDLMYEVVRNLAPKDLIYFLGDIKQLPPIGRGIPFSMLMTILPCVELGVSKRAASGSLVNYNCLLVNFLSGVAPEPLKGDKDTFIIDGCDDTLIPDHTCRMFKDLMNGVYGNKKYEEDDIQVITQYQDPKKSWSAPVLNPPLQKFLRQNDRLLFQNNDRDFYQNDRVIHVKRNSYEMKRYEMTGNVFKEVMTFGAVNGEVGKLVGIVRSDRVSIYPFDSNTYKPKDDEEAKLLERYREREDDLRDDSSFYGEEFYFVVVKYYDTDLHRDVYVLYRAHSKTVVNGYDNIMYLEGKDLGNLELAYALTAHKMQGSQSKAVIAVFGRSGSPMFVNRNMINVIITRSQEFVGLIGSVEGSNSAIERGRVNVSPRKRNDILGVLAGEVEI